ncbi:MAG: hypothetical protein GXO39_08195 [Thermotogae bacterium]|nr:hypothetical protein [Thermotogota bacterium]
MLDEEWENTNWKEEDIAVIVPSPEIEIWAWYDTQRLARALKVEESIVKECRKKYSLRENGKPERPKEALECIARSVKVPYGRGVLELIAKGVSRRVANACEDKEFKKFIRFLRK